MASSAAVFEAAELGHRLDKDTYDAEVPGLRSALLDAQYDLSAAGRFPVIVVIDGLEGAGKGETIHLLNDWLDPRFVLTNAYGKPTDEERERPPMWRYWRSLPPKGRIGIVFGSWYSRPLLQRVHRRGSKADLEQAIGRIVRFERLLTDEGALVLKFWLHLSKRGQRERFEDLARDPATRWRVTELDWERYNQYGRIRKAADRLLRGTSQASAPWIVVESSDARYRNLTVGRTLSAAIRERLDAPDLAPGNGQPPPFVSSIDGLSLLSSLDLSQSLPKAEYEEELALLQGTLNALSRKKAFRRRSAVLVFEGFDAAGKGGAIRRVAQALDARHYRIIPVSAPSEEERAHPYLWRFWRQLPRRGQFAIFDRSWYGRVLVERVEELSPPDDWRRAYSEIVEFEEQLARHGMIVVKLWLGITRDEQLARFRAREQTQFKRFKITQEDWHNRDKWSQYTQAAEEMLARTSTEIAPWILVEANDKRFARVKVLRAIVDRLRAAL